VLDHTYFRTGPFKTGSVPTILRSFCGEKTSWCLFGRRFLLANDQVLPSISTSSGRYIAIFSKMSMNGPENPEVATFVRRHIQTRTKSPKQFTPSSKIKAEADRIFGALIRNNELRGLSLSDFTDAAAELFVEINNLHPFKGGQRESPTLLSQRARRKRRP
jgi:hypothetical protein